MSLELQRGVVNQSGEATLAQAILDMAITDLRKHRMWAEKWFYSSSFEFWCQVLGLDSDVMRIGIFRRFSDSDHDSKHVASDTRAKTAAVVAAVRANPTARSIDIAKACGCHCATVRKYKSLQRQGQLELF